MLKAVSCKIVRVTVAMSYLAVSMIGVSHGSLSARAEVPSNIPAPPGGIINTGGWAVDGGTNGIPFDPGGVLGGGGSAGFDLPGGADPGSYVNAGIGGGGGGGGPFLGFLNGGVGSGGGNLLQNATFLTFLLTMFKQGSNTQKSASTAMENLQNVSKNGVSGVPASEAKPTPGNGTTQPPGNGSSTNPPAGNGSSNPNSPGKPTGVWQDPSKPGGNGNGNSKPGGSGSTPSKPGGSAAKPPPANDKPSQPPADNKPKDPPPAQPPSNPAPPPSGSGSTGQPSGTFFERGFVNSRF